MAATANAFTTVLAAFALTLISLPKAMRFPALVAGLWRVFTMQTPGIVNLPVLLISLPASSANASKAFVISDLFFSHAAANASAIAPLEIDFAPFIALMAFIAFIAFIAFLAIVGARSPC